MTKDEKRTIMGLRLKQRGDADVVYWSNTNWNGFLACVADLLETDEVRSMRDIRHHPGVSCYEHSLFVAYTSFRLARHWGLDYRTAARGGLLHDLYLYDPKVMKAHRQCFAHPRAAVENAAALCGGLTEQERNIILSHMWPIARRMPRCREAAVVCLVDKLCATAELIHIWKYIRQKHTVMA